MARFLMTLFLMGLPAILVWCLVMFARNEWTYRKFGWLNQHWYENAQHALAEAKKCYKKGDLHGYEHWMEVSKWWVGYNDEYATYDQVMRKFWVWDFEKFHYWPRSKPTNNVVEFRRVK